MFSNKKKKCLSQLPMTIFGHSILYNYLNVVFRTNAIGFSCLRSTRPYSLCAKLQSKNGRFEKYLRASMLRVSCPPLLEVRNVWFRSNPLKELLFTRDKWIYLPERIHTRRWLYFIVHFSRSIVTTVVEKAILRLVASPKTPADGGHCNIRFFTGPGEFILTRRDC